MSEKPQMITTGAVPLRLQQCNDVLGSLSGGVVYPVQQ